MITFRVSDVAPSKERQRSSTLAKLLHAKMHRLFEAAQGNVIDLAAPEGSIRLNGFVAAVHTAFEKHYPLVLSPDDVWLLIAQGFATHVELHAETLRDRLVRHEGKVTISVRRDDFVKGSPSNDWPGVFSELSDRIAEYIGKKRDLIVSDFSTTGPIEKAASEIVLFNTLQSYFEYEVVTLCGIPEITLLGTVEDWISIRRKAEVFAEFDMAIWVQFLSPILDRIIDTARGKVDHSFWQSFYKLNDSSGGPYVTGWINVLFPYIEATDPETQSRNPHANNFVAHWEAGLMDVFGGGPTAAEFPSGLRSAPFSWHYLGDTIKMEFLGGFMGLSQNTATGAVRPAIGWAIAEALNS